MSMPYPNRAIRIAHFVSSDQSEKDVLVTVTPCQEAGGEGFFDVCAYEVGRGSFGQDFPKLDFATQKSLSWESVRAALDRIDEELSIFEYTYMGLLEPEPISSSDVTAQIQPPKAMSAVDFFSKYEKKLDGFTLLPIVSGLRVWVIITDHVQFFDCRSNVEIQGAIYEPLKKELIAQHSNEFVADTVLEGFLFKGKLTVTDAYMVSGASLVASSYKSRMRSAVNWLLKKNKQLSNVSIAQGVNEPASELRILTATRSKLKPALYAKGDKVSVVVDKQTPRLASVFKLKDRCVGMSYVTLDGGLGDVTNINLPVDNLPSACDEFLVAGGFHNIGRIPVLV